MVGHAGSTTGIVHADVTLTRSKVKVKVTGLLHFRKLAKSCMLVAMTVSPLRGMVLNKTFENKKTLKRKKRALNKNIK